ncbi:hypothetical protein ANCCAN_02719 [Ancylostoma caninum]|uniref:SXP/RAL-2 family protein Ani s 5-like cation-binding domain-containing protein n=1 Tax=Ancylostoma caninum TaxID=29170 RepID=A0A368H3H1_ANCCA|nr:hypothetical protein ANCCAN_02719 [Ancylostoma caninum]
MIFQYFTIIAIFIMMHQAKAQCCDPIPTPSYSRMLRGIPREARRAFREIRRKEYLLPRSEVRAKMMDWAKKYNMTSELDALLKQNAETAQQIQTTIHMVIQQLPDFITRVNTIATNMSLSLDQVNNNIEQLRNSVNASLREAGCFIVSNANPSLYWDYSNYYSNYDLYGSINDYNMNYRRKRSAGHPLRPLKS